MNIEKMYNLDAEKNVLSSIFMYNDSICEVIDLIKTKDFYSSNNKIIYKNLVEMHDKRIPIDIVTFCDRMGEALKEIGGVSYITEIINTSVTATNVKRYGQIVKEKSNYRELMKIFESSMEKLKKADLTEKQWCLVTKAAAVFADSNMKIYNRIFKLNLIKSECRKLKIKEGLDIVVIDHLQLIEGVKSAENRNVEIAKITRELKLMAKELDVTVLLLSQLSRAPEARSDHRPMLSDLRESGSIEQDADIAMFLYRDDYYNKDCESKGIIECIVAKNRNGEVGTVRFRWLPEIQRSW